MKVIYKTSIFILRSSVCCRLKIIIILYNKIKMMISPCSCTKLSPAPKPNKIQQKINILRSQVRIIERKPKLTHVDYDQLEEMYETISNLKLRLDEKEKLMKELLKEYNELY